MKRRFFSLYLLGTLNYVMAQNPVLPPTAFIPDCEPDVFEYNGEQRLFLYGSKDADGIKPCAEVHDVWSAPVDDLTKWTDHGEIFNAERAKKTGYGLIDGLRFGAPDCVYNPVTKKYYFYTFYLANYKLDGIHGPKFNKKGTIHGYGEFGPKCVVSESDSPVGPFVNPIMCEWPAINQAGSFDPSVLVTPQKDGTVRVFAYWGMRKGDFCAELDPNDMCTIIDSRTGKPDPTCVIRTLNNPELNGHITLFEASSIKQVADDKFVFICSPNEMIPSLTYFYSNSPLGPWKHGGVIIENYTGWSPGNNHGSIVKVKDQWYIVYHRKTTNDISNRQTMIEPIDLRIEGDKVIIPQVEMTSQGVLKEGLPLFRRYNAYTIAYKSRKTFINGKERNPEGLNPVVVEGGKAMMGWKYFNLKDYREAKKKKLSLSVNMCLKDASTRLKVTMAPKPYDWRNMDKHIVVGEYELKKYIKADGKFHEVKLPLAELTKTLGNLEQNYSVQFSFESDNKNPCCMIREVEFLNK